MQASTLLSVHCYCYWKLYSLIAEDIAVFRMAFGVLPSSVVSLENVIFPENFGEKNPTNFSRKFSNLKFVL